MRGKGCVALVGIILIGAALLMALAAAGESAGLLRPDPGGAARLAAGAGLLGTGLFVAASRGRR